MSFNIFFFVQENRTFGYPLYKGKHTARNDFLWIKKNRPTNKITAVNLVIIVICWMKVLSHFVCLAAFPIVWALILYFSWLHPDSLTNPYYSNTAFILKTCIHAFICLKLRPARSRPNDQVLSTWPDRKAHILNKESELHQHRETKTNLVICIHEGRGVYPCSVRVSFI